MPLPSPAQPALTIALTPALAMAAKSMSDEPSCQESLTRHLFGIGNDNTAKANIDRGAALEKVCELWRGRVRVVAVEKVESRHVDMPAPVCWLGEETRRPAVCPRDFEIVNHVGSDAVGQHVQPEVASAKLVDGVAEAFPHAGSAARCNPRTACWPGHSPCSWSATCRRWSA